MNDNFLNNSTGIENFTPTLTAGRSVYVWAVLFISLTSQLAAQPVVVDFESLPVPPSGFVNGNIDDPSPYRDNFEITGTRDNFGETEFLQIWHLDELQFFNSYTPTFDSWSGFSWSTVADSATAGFLNQYAAFPGGGSDGFGGTVAGDTYVVSFSQDSSYVNLPELARISSIDVTNTTYAGISMRDGDSFAKQFGGPTGDAPDYFKLTFTGYSGLNKEGTTTGIVDFYLADYRFGDNSLDYIVDQWVDVDLTRLGAARSIGLSLTTTDVGSFGPNTPMYAALDNLTYLTVPEPSVSTLWVGCLLMLLSRKRALRSAAG